MGMRIDIGDGYGAVGSLFVCLFVCVRVFARQLSNKMIFNLDIWFYGPP